MLFYRPRFTSLLSSGGSFCQSLCTVGYVSKIDGRLHQNRIGSQTRAYQTNRSFVFQVSDIWRSYFTERLLWEMREPSIVAFAPPWVTQQRNPHSYLADFQAEAHLYERAR